MSANKRVDTTSIGSKCTSGVETEPAYDLNMLVAMLWWHVTEYMITEPHESQTEEYKRHIVRSVYIFIIVATFSEDHGICNWITRKEMISK